MEPCSATFALYEEEQDQSWLVNFESILVSGVKEFAVRSSKSYAIWAHSLAQRNVLERMTYETRKTDWVLAAKADTLGGNLKKEKAQFHQKILRNIRKYKKFSLS